MAMNLKCSGHICEIHVIRQSVILIRVIKKIEMKKTSGIILSLIVIVIVFSSCEKVTGDGPVVTETRNIVNYSGVDLRVSANVYFREDPNFKVEISAQRNILEEMETYVSDNTFVIKFKNIV